MNFEDFRTEVAKAESIWQSGRWRDAVAAYADLLSRRLPELNGAASAFTPADLMVVERLADLAVPLGETKAADDLYTALERSQQGTGNESGAVLATLKRLQLAFADERLEDGLALLRTLEPLIGALEHIEFTESGLRTWEAERAWSGSQKWLVESQLYGVLGRALAALGQFECAKVAVQRGLAHLSENESEMARQARDGLQLQLAEIELESGDFAAMRDTLTHIARNRARPADLLRIYELEANHGFLCGNYADAETAIRSALELCRQLGFQKGIGPLLASHGKALTILNRLEEAKSQLEAAMVLAEGTSDGALRQRVERIAGFLASRSSNVFGAEQLAESVSALQGIDMTARTSERDERRDSASTERPVSLWAYYVQRELDVVTRLERDEPERARRSLRYLEADFGETDSELIATKLRILEAITLYRAGGPERAERRLSDAATAAERLGLLPDLYQAQSHLLSCLSARAHENSEVASLRRRNQRVLDALASSLEGDFREIYLLNKWSERDRALADESSRLLERKDEVERKRVPIRWIARWHWYASVFRFCARAAPGRLESLDDERPVPSSRKLRELGRTLLSFLRHPSRTQTFGFLSLPDRVVTITARRLWLDVVVRPLTRARLRELVRDFHERVTEIGPGHGDGATRIARKLASELGLRQSLDRVPARVRSLRFLPDDQLHAFPFAAVPFGEQERSERYAVERWAISIGFRWPWLEGKSWARTTKDRYAVVAGVADAGPEFAILPEATAQLEWVSGWWERRGIGTRKYGMNFDKRALLATLKGASFFHFSGHGKFDPDEPSETGLVLARQGEQSTVLELRELLEMRCERLELVTLFSCWGADGFAFPGRWVVSLPQAMCRSGADSVIAFLWELEDRLSTKLVKELYEKIPSSSRAEALRAVQRAILAERGHSSPYWWAGVQLYGEPGVLRT